MGPAFTRAGPGQLRWGRLRGRFGPVARVSVLLLVAVVDLRLRGGKRLVGWGVSLVSSIAMSRW